MGSRFATDHGGYAFDGKDSKLQWGTYGMRLSQFHRGKQPLRILTYSLPDMAYITRYIGKRPWGVMLLCSDKFRPKAQAIKNRFPLLRVAVAAETHAKMTLLGPQTVTVGSANFGDSGWDELSISVHSQDLYAYAIREIFDPRFAAAEELEQFTPA